MIKYSATEIPSSGMETTKTQQMNFFNYYVNVYYDTLLGDSWKKLEMFSEIEVLFSFFTQIVVVDVLC